jgi:hypothetical protein
VSAVRPIDRALVRLYTGPIGRGTSFALELATALIRGLRGRAHPEDGSRR